MRLSHLYLSIALGATLASAQQAEVSGLVRDPSGSVVPNATVTIISHSTGTSRTVQSNSSGLYTFSSLRPGKYDIDVSAAGFKKATRSDLAIEVAQRASVDFTLEIGALEEAVTVKAGADLINSSDASVSTVIDRDFVGNLPLNGRGFNSLIELTPGVQLTKTNNTAQGQFSANGQRATSNYFTVDGVSANTSIPAGAGLNQAAAGTFPATSVLGGMNALVSVDALQEFRVQTSTFAPEYGRTPGAQISIATRAGGNAFHGDVFDYFRNDKLDANNWFANQTRQVKPALRQNDFGGVLGGPIRRNRTFFFVSYEGLRLRQPQTAVNYGVPSLAARQAASPVLQPYLNAYPLPNGPDLPNGSAVENATFSNPATFEAGSARLDQTVGLTTLFARFAYSPSAQITRGASTSLNTVTDVSIGNWSITLGAATALSPRVANEARLNWTVGTATNSTTIDTFGGAQPFSLVSVLPPSVPIDVSRFNFSLSGTGGSLGIGPTADNKQRQANVVDSLSVAFGSHLLKFGGDVRVLRPVLGVTQYLESVVFSSVGDPTKPVPQQTAGTFLSSIPSSASITSRPHTAGMQYLDFSFFVQDTWRISQRLTSTFGLRWDIDPPPTGTNHPLIALTNLQTIATVSPAAPGTPLWSASYRSIAPRAGFAYRMRNSARFATVWRAGAGVFYDLTGGLVGTMPGLPPNVNVRPLTSVTFPLSPSVAAPPGLPASPPYSGAAGVDPALQQARSYEWNTAIEQQLGAKGAVSATYAGALGRNLARTSVFFTPNSMFNSLLLQQSNSTSDYHSLQLQYHGTIGRSVQTLASYTWSHSIDSASSDFVTTSVPFSHVNPNGERGPSDFDARQAFSAALTLNSPQSSGRWWSALVRDWSLDQTFQARTAFPFDVLVQRDLGYGTYFFRPDIVPGQPEFVADPNVGGGRKLDTSRPAGVPNQVGAFVVPAALRQGDLSRNATRGFAMYQDDVALRREFSLKERLRFQVRAEMFNIFNHPNFGDPNTTIGSYSTAGVLTVSPSFGRSLNMLGTQLGSGGINGGLSPIYQIGGPRSTQLALKLIF